MNRGYDDFHLVHRDEINEIVSELIDFHNSKGRHIIIMTGRSEEYRKETEEWLNLYDIRYDQLLMRQKDDYKRDTVVKKELYNDNIKDKYNVICVFDDRLSVCRQWVDMGIFTFTVNQGLREF